MKSAGIKISFVFAIFSTTINANSEQCSKQLDGYIQGLIAHISTDDAFVSRESKNAAKKEVERIKLLRHSNSDCEIRKTIHILAIGDRAVERALNAADKSRVAPNTD